MTMPRRPDTHPRTRAVFETLAADPTRWWYGYDIAKRAGVSSGTLYPLLTRLSQRGYLIAKWEDDPPEGRPRRHLYQLTSSGLAHATELTRSAAQQAQAAQPAARRRSPSARPALDGA